MGASSIAVCAPRAWPGHSIQARQLSGSGSRLAPQCAARHQAAWAASSLASTVSVDLISAAQQDLHLQLPLQQQVIRVLAVTDLHVDYAENMAWCHSLDDEAYRGDVLVVSGDVSDELGALEEALGALAAKFGAVFYVPGNHELWIRERDRNSGILDSVTKLSRVLELCLALGVHTQPRRLGNLWLVPLLSWHHKSFDQEPDIPGVPSASSLTISDYGVCRWPRSVPGGDEHGSLELAKWFDGLNDTPAWRQLLEGREGCDVIALSHFLPHQALLPEKRYLFYPALAKAVGSVPLAARLAQLQPDLCLVGHTHFAWDAQLGGTRYIQAPLCSPLERQRRLFTVGFGGGMEEARADPLAARWLPVLVYRGLAAPAAAGAAPEAAAAGGHDSRGAARQVDQAAVAAAAESEESQQASPQQQQQQQRLQQQQQQQQQQQAVHDRLLRAWAADGWRPLRHGALAPPLIAHWSDYYAANARRPEDTVLAPWVAKMYERRRQRAARGAGTESEVESDID